MLINNSNTEVVGYKKLRVWQIADKYVKFIYKITTTFPNEELYNSKSQLRRAALSVVLNIIEGYARSSKNEFRQFLRISLGSLAESEYLLVFSFEQDYINKADYEEAMNIKEECGRVLWSLFKSQC